MENLSLSVPDLLQTVKNFVGADKHSALDEMLERYTSMQLGKQQLQFELRVVAGRDALQQALRAMVPQIDELQKKREAMKQQQDGNGGSSTPFAPGGGIIIRSSSGHNTEVSQFGGLSRRVTRMQSGKQKVAAAAATLATLLLLHGLALLLQLVNLRHHGQQRLPQRIAPRDHAQLKLKLLLAELLRRVPLEHLIERRVLVRADKILDGLQQVGHRKR